MKHKIGYKISSTKKAINVTITVPNCPEARTWIHDLVAIRIAKAGSFIGDVYQLKPGRQTRKGTFDPLHQAYAETIENARV